MTPDGRPSAGIPATGLQPPAAPLQAKHAPAGRQGLVWLALLFVIVLGLGVLLVLPKLVSPGVATGVEKNPTAAAVKPPAAPTDAALSRGKAEQALQAFLRTRARLELANVAIWGEPEWSQAVDGANRGNDLFTQRQFALAAEAFLASTDLLLALESGKGQRMISALDSGWQALGNDESVTAAGFFEIAKAIDPGSQDALDGLERAQVRPDLLRLMADGDFARSNDDLPGAQAVYLEAVALDGAYEPAQAALRDITAEINRRAFRDAMSRALGALQAEQLDTAEAALQQAAILEPDSEVVLNTRQELAQTRQKLWLEGQRRAVATAESNEDWPAAVSIYRQVLARMPQAAFARQGLVFAGDRERLHQQLDHYLDDPARLYSDQPRSNAEELLESVGSPPATETVLTDKADQLRKLIETATTPRLVTLQSDGLTSVQIYHVGRLGQFATRQLELRPGTYTVVGSRPGYRDVRQTLTVTPGSEQSALDIRCEERI